MEELISNVDAIVLSFVQGSFGSLTGIVQTLWHMMFVVFVAIYGYKIMVSGQFLASDLIMHCVKIVVLLALATQWDVFFLFIFRMTTDFPSDVAGQMMKAAASSFGAGTQANDAASVNMALSRFFDRGMAIAADILQGAGWNHVGLYLYAMAVWVGTIGVTGYAAMLIILSKLALAVLLAIGPLFILLLMFGHTKTLFDGWLRALLGYAFVPVFVYAMLSVLLVLAEAPLRHLEDNHGVYNDLMSSVGPYLLISIIAILLLSQILNIAASVTGGASLSTGGFARWSGKTLVMGYSGKMAAATGRWGWQKSESFRQYTAERLKSSASVSVKTGQAMLSRALNRSREVL